MNVATMFKTPRVRSRSHMAFVGQTRCVVCKKAGVQVHHLQHAQPRAKSLKSGDDFTVGLCLPHHLDVHRHDEATWWERQGIDAIAIAADLWAQSVAAGRA